MSEHENTGLRDIQVDSADEQILLDTSKQSPRQRAFLLTSPAVWVVFLREGGDRARHWSVIENHGELSNERTLRIHERESGRAHRRLACLCDSADV